MLSYNYEFSNKALAISHRLCMWNGFSIPCTSAPTLKLQIILLLLMHYRNVDGSN